MGARMKHQGERRQLCVDATTFRDRLLKSGLWKTMHKMDEVVKQIGYECAEQFEKEARCESRRKS